MLWCYKELYKVMQGNGNCGGESDGCEVSCGRTLGTGAADGESGTHDAKVILISNAGVHASRSERFGGMTAEMEGGGGTELDFFFFFVNARVVMMTMRFAGRRALLLESAPNGVLDDQCKTKGGRGGGKAEGEGEREEVVEEDGEIESGSQRRVTEAAAATRSRPSQRTQTHTNAHTIDISPTPTLSHFQE